MVRKLALILMASGLLLLAYDGFQLYNSSAKERQRLKEVSAIVSDKVINEVNHVEKFNYDSIKEGSAVGVFYIPRLDRDTVFRQFGELEDSDELHVKMEHGTFIYEIRDHEIFPVDDTPVINPSQIDEVLIVSTCYPFSFIGSPPDRYVI